MSKVENYSKSIEIKKQQLESLEASVEAASNLFQNARVEYSTCYSPSVTSWTREWS